MRKTPLVLLAMITAVATACSGGDGDIETVATSTTTSTGSTASTTTGESAMEPAQRDCGAAYLAQFTSRQKLAQLLTVACNGYLIVFGSTLHSDSGAFDVWLTRLTYFFLAGLYTIAMMILIWPRQLPKEMPNESPAAATTEGSP